VVVPILRARSASVAARPSNCRLGKRPMPVSGRRIAGQAGPPDREAGAAGVMMSPHKWSELAGPDRKSDFLTTNAANWTLIFGPVVNNSGFADRILTQRRRDRQEGHGVQNRKNETNLGRRHVDGIAIGRYGRARITNV